MIQNIPENEVCTGKSIKSNQAGMEFNAKAFHVLSDQLYTYKERAVAREYMTNAYDSHQDAGCADTPFRVHVPTELEPWFEVQDFGLGLSGEGVVTTFSTFFHSTKENDNSVTGCFGLGSKAGLAVSNQFTVTSIKDGVKTVHVFYKDKQGIPTVDLKSETATDEGNGVTIRLPVDLKRLSVWEKEVVSMMGNFSVTPIHNLSEDDALLNTLLTQKERSTRIREENGFVDFDKMSAGCKVFMGNVIYPVEDWTDFIKSKELRKLADSVKNKICLRIKAPLGTLNVAPNREGLSLDEYTKANLSRMVTRLVVRKYREMQLSIGDDVTSYYTFYKKFHKTDLWENFMDMVFPFTRGKELAYWESEYWGRANNFYPLKGFDNLKAFVPTVFDDTPSVLSQSLQGMTHRRVRKWDNIHVAKGTSVRLRDTLKNIAEKLGAGAVIYINNDSELKFVKNWFGVSDDKVVDCEEYFVQRERKKPTLSRKALGKLEDDRVMAKSVTLANGDEGYKDTYLDDRTAYVLGDSFKVSIGENTCTYTKIGSGNFMKIMRLCGVEKVVMVNANNQNKIFKNNVPNLNTLWENFVKKNKRIIVKQSVWDECLHLTEAQELLKHKVPALKKFERQKQSVKGIENFPNLSAYSLGLVETKLYKQEKEREEKSRHAALQGIKSLTNKLPLWDSVKYNTESAEYYLKLEKIIK